MRSMEAKWELLGQAFRLAEDFEQGLFHEEPILVNSCAIIMYAYPIGKNLKYLVQKACLNEVEGARKRDLSM